VISRMETEAGIPTGDGQVCFADPQERSSWRLGVAVSVLTAMLLVAVAVREVSLTPVLAESLDAGLNDITVAESLKAGQRLSTSGGATLKLIDGSLVEMRAYSELSLERADDGVRIRLKKGGVIVNAAKQGAGHLYVRTKDVDVSVVGTVFFVSAEETGSSVA